MSRIVVPGQPQATPEMVLAMFALEYAGAVAAFNSLKLEPEDEEVQKWSDLINYLMERMVTFASGHPAFTVAMQKALDAVGGVDTPPAPKIEIAH